jgi:hypothetical protein
MHWAVLTAKIIQRSFVRLFDFELPCEIQLTMIVTSTCSFLLMLVMYRDIRIPCELRPGTDPPAKACCG